MIEKILFLVFCLFVKFQASKNQICLITAIKILIRTELFIEFIPDGFRNPFDFNERQERFQSKSNFSVKDELFLREAFERKLDGFF